MILAEAFLSIRELSVTIIIPTRNEKKNIRHCLDRVRTQKFAGKTNIIVIDSSSTDGTPEIARSAGAQVISISRTQFSHGRTRQIAAESAPSCDLIVFTVADAVPAGDDWLTELVRPMGESNIAGSFGIQVLPPGTIGEPYKKYIYEKQNKLKDRIVRFSSTMEWDALRPKQKRDFANFDNCTSCVRRSLILGEHPIPNIPYGEDMFWAAEVLRSGYGIARCSKAKVNHVHEENFTYLFYRMLVDSRLCSLRFGYRPIPGIFSLVVRLVHMFLKVTFIDLILGYRLTFYRLEMRVYWTIRDLWRQSGAIFGKYAGSLPESAKISRWRPIKRRFAKFAEALFLKTKPLHRSDFTPPTPSG